MPVHIQKGIVNMQLFSNITFLMLGAHSHWIYDPYSCVLNLFQSCFVSLSFQILTMLVGCLNNTRRSCVQGIKRWHVPNRGRDAGVARSCQ